MTRYYLLTLVVACAIPALVVAQTAEPPTPSRLSVRPQTMATGTRTVQAGVQRLDSLKNYYVYVPPQCVGTRRVPLVVFLHGGGDSARLVINRQRQLADKYGMILLAPNAVAHGRWDVIQALSSRDRKFDVTMFGPDVRNIDAALRQVLRTYAINPERIALAGFSNGADYALWFGLPNAEVFSRIIAMSGPNYPPELSPPYAPATLQNKSVQFFLSVGLEEGEQMPLMLHRPLTFAPQLRHQGFQVETVIGLRGHEEIVEEEDYMWRWLQRSWAAPHPHPATARAPRRTESAAEPLLTVETLPQLTNFWTRFRQEPDSIQVKARQTHQQVISVAIGQQQWRSVVVDLPALVAQYPSVAADLKAAGLSARQAATYLAALISARATKISVHAVEGNAAGPVAATSVLGRNVAFLDAHPRELAALTAVEIWTTP